MKDQFVYWGWLQMGPILFGVFLRLGWVSYLKGCQLFILYQVLFLSPPAEFSPFVLGGVLSFRSRQSYLSPFVLSLSSRADFSPFMPGKVLSTSVPPFFIFGSGAPFHSLHPSSRQRFPQGTFVTIRVNEESGPHTAISLVLVAVDRAHFR